MAVDKAVLGLRFYIDTNLVGNVSDEMIALRALDADGWIQVIRTDIVDTELGNTKDLARRVDLLRESSGFAEAFGPFVLGHSRLGSAVLGNNDDSERLDRVYAILFPESDRHDESRGRSRRKIRDAMHVATTIRYGGDGFITLDDEDLLSKAEAIASAFNGFRIMSPRTALNFAQRMKDRHDRRQT